MPGPTKSCPPGADDTSRTSTTLSDRGRRRSDQPAADDRLSRNVNPAIALAGFRIAFPLCGVLYNPRLVWYTVAATR